MDDVNAEFAVYNKPVRASVLRDIGTSPSSSLLSPPNGADPLELPQEVGFGPKTVLGLLVLLLHF